MAEVICKIVLIALFIYRGDGRVNTRYYPRYHYAPQFGWMNDPNGVSYFKHKYHLFYQYNPKSSLEPGIANWGHAVSNNLVQWQHLPIAMKPDESYDRTGVFSGSAIVVNDTLYLIYTGNVNFPGQNPDHKQVQALAYTTDGINVTKYDNNPIIKEMEFQPDFRDPKVWKDSNGDDDDCYNMILGNSIDNIGRVLLLRSKNLIDWKVVSVLDESDGSLGYMWECPDFFELDGRYILLFSPQGIPPQGDKYRNLYQTGYMVGTFDHESGYFDRMTEFRELDNGHDFYATQTLVDAKGRRIAIAWFDMWENVYPERNDGWTGQMTIPRKLSLTREGRLLQKPIDELDLILGEELYSGQAGSGHVVKLLDKSGKVAIRSGRNNSFCLHIQDTSNSSNEVVLLYNYKKGHVTLDRGGGDGVRRTKWRPQSEYLVWIIYIDASSVELFCGEGEVTFSSRFFPKGDIAVKLGDDSYADDFTVYAVNRSIPLPN